MSDEFKRYLVDVHEAGVVGRLATALRVHGVATFEGVADRRAMIRLGSRLMRVTAHRHSERDGVTMIDGRRPDGCAAAGSAGFAGFTRRRLAPHTDCSALPEPPGLLMMVCLRPAPTGGDCVLIDGQRVYYAAGGEPGLLPELRAPLSAVFGNGSGYTGSIYTRVEPDRVTIRLRLDGQVRFAPGLQVHLPALRRLLHRHQLTIRLDIGQGYLLSNTRWLHGRSGYTGERVMLRLLGDPWPQWRIERGFHTYGGRRGWS